jgi:bla regulator protein BlaR1
MSSLVADVPMLEWLLAGSLKGAVVVALVLLVQWVARPALSPGWRYGLWFLVLASLVLPVAPISPDEVLFQMDLPAMPSLSSPRGGDGDATAAVPARVPEASFVREILARPSLLLGTIWILGLLALTGRAAIGVMRFESELRRGRPVADGDLRSLLAEAARAMEVDDEIEVVETGLVEAPALYGLFRPCILLPSGLKDALDRSELRHVLLHELAHRRRRDQWVQLAVDGLAVLHWFNPVVRLGLRRMRADRELVCDAMVLARLEPGERTAYGRTLVKILERALGTRSPLFGVGMAETAALLRQRVHGIATPARHRWHHHLVAAVAGASLAAVVLTDMGALSAAVTESEKERQKETVLRMRSIGNALMAWYTDEGITAGDSSESEGEDDSGSGLHWSDCPSISHEELSALLVPRYLDELPMADGWGAAFELCLDTSGSPRAAWVAAVRSAGSDGRFDVDRYTPGAFPADETENDIVWMDGYFARWPQAGASAANLRTVVALLNGETVPFTVASPRDHVYEIEPVFEESGTRVRMFSEDAGVEDFMVLSHQLDVSELRGRRVRFSGWLQGSELRGEASLALLARLPRDKAATGRIVYSTSEQPVRGSESWRRQTVELDIPAESERVDVAIRMEGGGRGVLSARDLTFEILPN